MSRGKNENGVFLYVSTIFLKPEAWLDVVLGIGLGQAQPGLDWCLHSQAQLLWQRRTLMFTAEPSVAATAAVLEGWGSSENLLQKWG